MNGRSGVIIKSLLAMPVAMLAQVGVAAIAGMFAGIAASDNGAPIQVQGNLFLMALVSCAAFLLVTILFTAYFDKKPLSVIGFDTAKLIPQFLIGTCAAVFILCLSTWVLLTVGNIQYTDFAPKSDQLLMNALAMLLIATGEESLFRGYIQRNLQMICPKWVALFGAALLFTVAHLGNPNVMQPLPILGVFAGGLLLGVNYAFTNNLWLSIGLHFAWNYLQGPILGFSVSGMENKPLLMLQDNGPVMLTGGSFGLEGSVIAITFVLLLTRFFWWRQSIHFK